MKTDASVSYPLNRNVSLDLSTGAIHAFLPEDSVGVEADRISGTLLTASFDQAPMGISYIYPKSSRRGSIALDEPERTHGILFDAGDPLRFEKDTVIPLAVIEKTPAGIALYMRPQADESRVVVMGKDMGGYFVRAKLIVREDDLAGNPGLQTAFREVVPISSYVLPVTA